MRDVNPEPRRKPRPEPRLFCSELLTRLGVPHAFSTRIGGVSSGVFESLNFGNPAEFKGEQRDPPANIQCNLELVQHAIGALGREVVQVYQVHGASVHVLTAGRRSHPTPNDTKADAMVTRDPSRVLVVRVADCAPVLLSSGDAKVVAAVHAGWRGVVSGVLLNAVRVMRSEGAREIVAAIGPCIGASSFEVGPEVLDEFVRAFGGEMVGELAGGWRVGDAIEGVNEAGGIAGRGAGAPPKVVAWRRADEKAQVDLRAALEVQLGDAGVDRGRIEHVGGCTARDASLYFSHRRDQGKTGRLIGMIGVGE
ncbi:MAG: peptidoglycan editing factor PgeF [Phycisphaerales bacterium]|jgi:YfiH family protein|nr:peptidoglycan editing factor PgeF [Phycisphaerales bacterium]